MMILPSIPRSWHAQLGSETEQPYYRDLDAFLDRDARRYVLYPPRPEIFQALELTSYRAVKVVIVGQDPYPGEGQAHGLAFSVRPGVKPPASLRNIFTELHDDLGVSIPGHGCLTAWAAQGVLLLNAVLTVRHGLPNSHRGIGWEHFTNRVIRQVSAKRKRVVFVLWGAFARRKAPLIDASRHAIIDGVHPSPLSARHGFFGSRPFSRINTALAEAGRGPIDWRLPEL
jgi:uracil-DNA glycosylase